MITLLGQSTAELRAWCKSLNEPEYRGSQVAEWIYRHAARSFEEMTNLSRPLRARLAETAVIGHLPLLQQVPSKDGSAKLLLERSDGERIETVGLPYPDRVSCCVSSQIGCPIGCTFCATGLSGFSGNLTAGEIIAQVLETQHQLRIADCGLRNDTASSSVSDPQCEASKRSRGATRKTKSAIRNPQSAIDHVVFMGMGEPLLNYENVLKAVRLLNEEMNVGMRQLTVSTVGLVPQMRRLAEEKLQLTLAVSLHAPTNELRRQLVPGTRGFSVEEIVGAARYYAELTGRRVTFEYVLLGGVNDGAAEARRLAGLIRDVPCHVNLIPFNPVDTLDYTAPPAGRVRHFREILEAAKIPVTQRVQRGADANAACGQLRRRSLEQSAIRNPPVPSGVEGQSAIRSHLTFTSRTKN